MTVSWLCQLYGMQYGLLLATFNTSSDTTHCLVQGFH
ncbi:hypothetical protein EMCRGX_G032171 [Ephydatia muelleri]